MKFSIRNPSLYFHVFNFKLFGKLLNNFLLRILIANVMEEALSKLVGQQFS